jgi:hypothetical protein
MSRIIFTSLSGVTPLNIYVSDVLGGHETYLGEITTLPLVSDVFFDLPIIFNSSPQVTIIIEDSEECRTTKKLNCYIDCDIIYNITNITSITPTPTPTPSSTPGYIPAPVTNNTITLTSVTGLLPLSVYISDINGNYNTYVGIITNSTVLPISFDIPTRFEGSTQVILTINDGNSCSYFKIIDCGVINTPTPTPTSTVTPSITPTNQTSPTPTPTNTITPSVTPSNQTSPTLTPTNTVTPSVTPSITPSAQSIPNLIITIVTSYDINNTGVVNVSSSAPNLAAAQTVLCEIQQAAYDCEVVSCVTINGSGCRYYSNPIGVGTRLYNPSSPYFPSGSIIGFYEQTPSIITGGTIYYIRVDSDGYIIEYSLLNSCVLT